MFLGIPHFLKLIITYEKYYLIKPKKCQTNLQKLLEENHLKFELPNTTQLQNYLYRYKEKLLAENYPEVKKFLTEVCSKHYSENLNEDEMFCIFYKCQDGEVSVLLSTPAMIKNLLKQSQMQDCLIHLDATYKLIDLGIPIIIMGTENLNHNHRPIVYFITWPESKSSVKLMLQEMSNFLEKEFQFVFKPQIIMTDNSDSFIYGCKEFFSHKYTHMLCHFHIEKGLKEKLAKKDLKEVQNHIRFGVKTLKIVLHIYSLSNLGQSSNLIGNKVMSQKSLLNVSKMNMS